MLAGAKLLTRTALVVSVSFCCSFLFAVSAGADYSGVDFDALGCLAFWPFDGDAIDATGNGNDGVVSGAAVDGAGVFGQCYDFDGSQYVNLGESYSPPEVTYAFWFKGDQLSSYAGDATTDARIPFRRRGDNADHEVRVWSDKIIVWMFDLGGFPSIANLSADVALSTGSWYHLAFSYDGTDFNLYLDGLLVDSQPVVAGAIDWSGHQGTFVGYGQDAGHHWDGDIDEVAVFDRALTQPQIAALRTDDNDNQIADFWEGVWYAGNGYAFLAIVMLLLGSAVLGIQGPLAWPRKPAHREVAA